MAGISIKPNTEVKEILENPWDKYYDKDKREIEVPNVSVYEVKQGTIAANNIYKGLIIRSEEIVYADQTGYVDYYWKGGEKASVVDNI